MKVFYSSPLVGVKFQWEPTKKKEIRRYEPSKGRKLDRKEQATKYDYKKMAEDRISGMKWSDIAKKHAVPRGSASAAQNLFLNSMYLQRASVEVIAALNIKEFK